MKVKILKKLPKSKCKKNTKLSSHKKTTLPPVNKFTEKYLDYYDDIKIPTKRYDW